jgi:hypothetical protein
VSLQPGEKPPGLDNKCETEATAVRNERRWKWAEALRLTTPEESSDPVTLAAGIESLHQPTPNEVDLTFCVGQWLAEARLKDLQQALASDSPR